MMQTDHHIAHMNVARLQALPGDPLVAGFIDAVPRVNAIAERSPGFVWRLVDEDARVSEAVMFETLFEDPCIAVSLSVWQTARDLQHFVQQTVHGGFVRRRAEWFEPMDGPNYVIWPIAKGEIPTLSDGHERLKALATHGPTDQAYDFAYLLKSAE